MFTSNYKLFSGIALLLLFSLFCHAEQVRADDRIYQHVDKMPEYLGGESARHAYLNANLRDPETLKEGEKNIYSICRYIIEKDGSISNVEVVQSADIEYLDYVAIRLISIMPNWIPGTNNGELVRVQRVDSVGFTYDESTQKTLIDSVQIFVDKRPEFPGGDAAMMKYLSSELFYPEIARLKNIQGRVVCQFMVNEDGSISDIQVVKSVHKSLDKEAVRVIKHMPKWIPGEHRGKAVRVRYTLPIMFRL